MIEVGVYTPEGAGRREGQCSIAASEVADSSELPVRDDERGGVVVVGQQFTCVLGGLALAVAAASSCVLGGKDQT